MSDIRHPIRDSQGLDKSETPYIDALHNAQTKECLWKILTENLPASQRLFIHKLSIKEFYDSFFEVPYITRNSNYREISIKKKDGSERRIHAPCEELKFIQRKLAFVLSECYEELEKRNLKKLRIKKNQPEKKFTSLSHGFRPSHSPHSNAHIHKGKRCILNFDLENFFPSIYFQRVFGYLTKSRDFRLRGEVAIGIARLSCYQERSDRWYLPQGSPCSPVISNLIGQILDLHLLRMAKAHECTYSRYADDITFSTYSENFPISIAVSEGHGRDKKWRVSRELQKEVENAGFKINHSKTRLSYKRSRQSVTGLVVNEHVNVSQIYYRQTRAMLHTLYTKGIEEVKFPSGDSNRSTRKELRTYARLEGRLGHIYHSRGWPSPVKPQSDNLTGIHKMYANFVLFKMLMIHPKPIIVCEGKTDVIYLKCSLKKIVR